MNQRPARTRRADGSTQRAARTPEPPPAQHLASALGNHAFARLVARQGSAKYHEDYVPPAPKDVEPRHKSTDFGEFLIYPDRQGATLGPASYHEMAPGHYGPADAFRVTESTFARIELALSAVKKGSGWLTIDGSDAFKGRVLPDLAWLLTSSVGEELFTAMSKTARKLTIKETGGGNATSYDPDADSWELAGGKAGKGCDVTVKYNTGEWNPYGGTEDWMMRPPAIGLAHEMVHAWTGMTGTRAKGTVEVDGVTEKRRELQATGLGEWEKATLTENRFRAAFGLPLRPKYTT